jgi:hypothetical protein
MRFISLVLILMLARPLQGQQAPATSNTKTGNRNSSQQQNEVADSRMKTAIMLALQMNVFRLSAGFDVDRTIQVWANKEFQAKWQKEVLPLFTEKADRPQLHDFFSSSVVFLGRAGLGRGVVAFYNPWIDGLLLIAAEPGKEHPVLTDFRFVAGETWRGEKPRTGEDLLKLYMLKEPLTIALARNYSTVVGKFNQFYPPDGAFEFLPGEVAKGIGRTGEELAPIKGRMLYRAKMFRMLFAKENMSAVKVAKELRHLLPEGDVKKLAAYLSPRQNGTMLQTICSMPALLRRNLAPNYFVHNKTAGGYLLALVNSEMPRWIFSVQILDKGPDAKPEITIEAMDLESSSRIVAKLKEVGK